MKNAQGKKCAMCGGVLTDARKRYCPQCLKKKRRDEYKKPKQIQRAACVIKKPKPVKVDTTQCRTCLYRCGINTITCGYAEDTGHSRNCEPSPNCTAYKKGTRAERKEMRRKRRAMSVIYEPTDEYAGYTCERIARRR